MVFPAGHLAPALGLGCACEVCVTEDTEALRARHDRWFSPEQFWVVGRLRRVDFFTAPEKWCPVSAWLRWVGAGCGTLFHPKSWAGPG